MSNFKDVMIDIETMGVKSDAVILSVAACYFDRDSGEIGDTFDEQINLNSSMAAGRDICPSTLLWWMGQSDDARGHFKGNARARKMSEVLTSFSEFITPGVNIWGNGSSFDLGILTSGFNRCRIATPWKFWNERDVRTIVDIGWELGFDPKRDMPFEGVRHNALDDSKHQAKYVSAIFRKIKGGE